MLHIKLWSITLWNENKSETLGKLDEQYFYSIKFCYLQPRYTHQASCSFANLQRSFVYLFFGVDNNHYTVAYVTY